MSTVFGAHIITAEADLAEGHPEIIVTIGDKDDEYLEEHPLAHYPLSNEDTLQSALDKLWYDHGWRVLTDPKQEHTAVDVGYDIVEVEPVDYEQIVQHVTFAREKAQIEYERQDTAWREIIRHAMHDNASATALARAAKISRERVYQIRDGRR